MLREKGACFEKIRPGKVCPKFFLRLLSALNLWSDLKNLFPFFPFFRLFLLELRAVTVRSDLGFSFQLFPSMVA
jgi:hypothetical protein